MILCRSCRSVGLLFAVWLSAPAIAFAQTGSNTPPTMDSTIMPWWQTLGGIVLAGQFAPEHVGLRRDAASAQR